ncbi:MAG TPA: hypothetical protein P5509_08845 [Bacteroidales bacterium]|nr:hypothetical protein [Bacteroidales bacterium]
MKQRIPSFDNFELNEGLKYVKSDKRIQELNHYMWLNKERGADGWQWCQIPNKWKVYKKQLPVPKEDLMAQSQCYENALVFAKKNPEYKLILGAFIILNEWTYTKRHMNKEDYNKFNPYLFVYPHAFNVNKNNEIYDVTIDNRHKDCIYVGTEIDPKKYSDGFKQLMPLVVDMLGKDSGANGIEKDVKNTKFL